MKKYVRVLLLFGVLLVLVGCLSKPSPEKTLESVFKAISNGNVEDAKDYFTTRLLNGEQWLSVPFDTFSENCYGKSTDLTYMASYSDDYSADVKVYYGTENVIRVEMVQIGKDWYIESIFYEDCETIKTTNVKIPTAVLESRPTETPDLTGLEGVEISYLSSYQSDGHYLNIDISDIQGINKTEIIHADDLGNGLHLSSLNSWSPDGKYLAFGGEENCHNESENRTYICRSVIYLWTRETSEIIQITPDGDNYKFVGWSPDSNYLAFSCVGDCLNESENYKYQCRSVIYLWTRETGEIIQITPDEEYYGFAGWSPDSNKILMRFEADPEQWRASEIMVSNRDGSGRISLITSTQDKFVFNLVWSPNGSQIAMIISENDLDIPYLINADGTGLRELSSDFVPTKDSWMSQTGLHWSPDSRYLGFNDGPMKVVKRKLYVYDTFTGELVQPTKEKGFLIKGWINETKMLANSLDKIVLLGIDGQVETLTEGDEFLFHGGSNCFISPSKEFLIARITNDGVGFWGIFELSTKQWVVDLSVEISDGYDYCWVP